ncbi:GMC oxidoreductase [uncultured Amnibacterium sp.]|uniref:GMC oxidoreductase n=1 Tax=uncultured Amnibacterium sp. TaxID=1631851 RepID=UPI0035CBF9C8
MAETDPTSPDAVRTVVLGSGPAGVTTVVGLARRGVPVLLVEGGTDRESDDDRALNAGAAAEGVWGHEPLGEHRRRVLGGASTAWGGRCIPLEPIDFEPRDWVPGSGWPIPYAEFHRWLPEACDLLQIPETDFRRPSAAPLFGDDGAIDGAAIEVWSPPVVFSDVLRAAQQQHPNLQVATGTHVTRVRTAEDGTVVGLEAVRDGQPLTIEGARFVLATGTLENTRLLLDSPLAPSLPALGRYYQSHTFATDFAVTGPALPPDADFFRIGSAYARRRWQLSPQAQRDRRVGNVIGFVARPPVRGVSLHVDPLSALVGAVKIVRGNVTSPARLLGRRGELGVYARVLVRTTPAFWVRVAAQTARRRGRNRLPMLLPPRTASVHHVTVQGEHLPHPDSRVLLTTGTDRYGVPLLATDIDFHRQDFETIDAFHRALEAFLGARGYRAVTGPAEALRSLARNMRLGFNSNAHHIGTARMGTDRATSVVDPDCRVHGSANLYVAGAAVFPTSGHVNPTLSIVMLAARLADHLAGTR